MIIMHLMAQLCQFWSLITTVCETMKMNFYTCICKSLDAIKNINNTPIIGRPGNVESDNMKMHRQFFF